MFLLQDNFALAGSEVLIKLNLAESCPLINFLLLLSCVEQVLQKRDCCSWAYPLLQVLVETPRSLTVAVWGLAETFLNLRVMKKSRIFISCCTRRSWLRPAWVFLKASAASLNDVQMTQCLRRHKEGTTIQFRLLFKDQYNWLSVKTLLKFFLTLVVYQGIHSSHKNPW